jgi:hypothetical protein
MRRHASNDEAYMPLMQALGMKLPFILPGLSARQHKAIRRSA